MTACYILFGGKKGVETLRNLVACHLVAVLPILCLTLLGAIPGNLTARASEKLEVIRLIDTSVTFALLPVAAIDFTILLQPYT
jgi:hypothetical protein